MNIHYCLTNLHETHFSIGKLGLVFFYTLRIWSLEWHQSDNVESPVVINFAKKYKTLEQKIPNKIVE